LRLDFLGAVRLDREDVFFEDLEAFLAGILSVLKSVIFEDYSTNGLTNHLSNIAG
jgi:hypothetical protein